MHTDVPEVSIMHVGEGIWIHRTSGTYGFLEEQIQSPIAQVSMGLRLRWHAHLSEDINDPVPTNDGHWPDCLVSCPGWASDYLYSNPRYMHRGNDLIHRCCLTLMWVAVAPSRLLPFLVAESSPEDIDREDYAHGCRLISKHRLANGIMIDQ